MSSVNSHPLMPEGRKLYNTIDVGGEQRSPRASTKDRDAGGGAALSSP